MVVRSSLCRTASSVTNWLKKVRAVTSASGFANEEHWHYDLEGNKTYTMLKKGNPFTDGFQKWELHGRNEAAFQSEACSLGDAVISLVADEKIRQLLNTREYSENAGDIDSMSSGRESWSGAPMMMMMKKGTVRILRTIMKTVV